MTTAEKRSAGTTYDDHDTRRERDGHLGRVNYPGWVSHQQCAGLAAVGDVMSAWTDAFYDCAEQVLKVQRWFAGSVLGASAAMLDGGRDVMSPDAHESRSANQPDARDNQYYEGSTRSRTNELYNDDDTAEHNKRSIDNDMSGNPASDTSRTERANTQRDESAKTRARGGASTEKKLS